MSERALYAGLTVGKYELVRELGEGGFGVVFFARDRSLDRELAVKFLHADLSGSGEVVQRFLQEARAAARIRHPGIVTIYECAQVSGTGTAADGSAYIAMELLHGETLAARVRRQGRLDPQTAVQIGRQIASALGAAHERGIVHRDLKPDNIFVVPDPEVATQERIKVVDFGIAKLSAPGASSVRTQALTIFGTPLYMSPEQCRSAAEVDGRSDVYSLGCMLYEMLAGAPPFTGEPGEVLAKQQLAEPEPLGARAPAVPAALAQVIAKAMAKDPARRHQTMDELRAALGASLPEATSLPPAAAASAPPSAPGAPSPAAGVPSPAQVAPSRRRRRIAIAVIGATAVVAAGIAFLVAGGSRRAAQGGEEPYELADISKKIARGLPTKIEATAYIANVPETVEPLRREVIRLLEAYRVAGGGRFSYVVVDPSKDEAARRSAGDAGISEVSFQVVDKDRMVSTRGHLAVLFRTSGGQQAPWIPSVETIGQEARVSTLLHRLSRATSGRPITVGVTVGQGEEDYRALWTAYGGGIGLSDLYDIEFIDWGASPEKIHAVDILVVNAPSAVSPAALDALGQRLARGAAVLILRRGVALGQTADTPPRLNASVPGDGLEALLASFGLSGGNEIVLDPDTEPIRGTSVGDAPIHLLFPTARRRDAASGFAALKGGFAAPLARTLEVDPTKAPPGALVLFETSSRAVARRGDPVLDATLVIDPALDRPGPHALVWASPANPRLVVVASPLASGQWSALASRVRPQFASIYVAVHELVGWLSGDPDIAAITALRARSNP